jgi:flagellar basal-body rod protein FlgB
LVAIVPARGWRKTARKRVFSSLLGRSLRRLHPYYPGYANPWKQQAMADRQRNRRQRQESAMIGKLDQAMQFNEAALSLRGQRQQIIASNIANADTPNFKARDIDFTKALQGAMSRAAGGPSASLATTSSAHLTAAGTVGGSSGASAALMYRLPQQGSIDGNTVEMDNERNQFADNAIRYEAGLTLISTQIKNMLAAIQG